MTAKRALAVTAHPDDIEFGCAGTVATWVDEGWDVRYVIVTSGQKGSQDVHARPEDVAAVREAESRRAAEICGVTDVTFLGYVDSELLAADPLALRRDLSRQFRRHRPHRLVTADSRLLPTEWFVNHPDHRTVGEAVLDITVTGGTTAAIHPELARDEGLAPWRGLEEVWLTGPAPGPVAVDVTQAVDRKIAALKAHASQTGQWDDLDGFVRGYLRKAGEPHGMEYAETFQVVAFRR